MSSSGGEAAAAISRREINDSHYKLSDHDYCSAARGRKGEGGAEGNVLGQEGGREGAQHLGYLAVCSTLRRSSNESNQQFSRVFLRVF